MPKKKRTLSSNLQYQLDFGYPAPKLLTYNKLIENNSRGVRMLASKRDAQAEEFYRATLGSFYKQQSIERTRYHKGLPYHNLAVVLAVRGKYVEAAESFFLAFIEDVLTFGNEASNYMSARTLRLLNVQNSFIEKVKSAALSVRESSPQAPEHIWREFEKELTSIQLSVLCREDLMSLITTETSQGLSSIVEVQTNEILRQVQQDRLLARVGFIIGVVSLILAVISLFH